VAVLDSILICYLLFQISSLLIISVGRNEEMKISIRLLCCLLLLVQTAPPSGARVQQAISNGQQSAAPATGQPVLEDGTPIRLRFSRTVSSANAHLNDRVEFEVLEEVKVAGVVVIPKSGIAWGTVTEAQSKRRMARGGKLEIVLDTARLVDGERIALRATQGGKGGGHTGAMVAGIVATGLLVWPAAPFFLFMHGKDISIPKGTEFPAFTEGNLRLDLAKFQLGAAQSAPPVTAPPQPTTPVGDVSQTQPSPNAEVEVSSTPSGAEIQVDGKFFGNTPSTIGIAPGDHRITVNKAGYKTWERTNTISTGKDAVAAVLEADGKVETTAEPIRNTH
jgi:hypothetical protein